MSANIHTHKHLYIFSPQVDPKPFYIRKKKKKKTSKLQDFIHSHSTFHGHKGIGILK